MKYTLTLFCLLSGVIYAQCDYPNELQCSSNSDCNWEESIEWYSCSNFTSSDQCNSYSQYGCYTSWNSTTWEDDCNGPSFQIDNSYCHEIEVLECYEMNELECNNNGICDWVDNIEYGNCSNYNNGTTCDANENCFWDLCYGGSYGSWSHCCRGGTYQIDNSYCDDVSFNPGDANGDGLLNVSDVVLIVQTILSGEYDLFSDYNQDGVINIVDIIGIINEILGK